MHDLGSAAATVPSIDEAVLVVNPQSEKRPTFVQSLYRVLGHVVPTGTLATEQRVSRFAPPLGARDCLLDPATNLLAESGC